MTAIAPLAFWFVVVLSGCAALQSAGDVNHGRQAFLIGNNEAALSFFQSAAQRDPNYMYGTDLRQGIWSYVGRSEYAVGRLPQARQTLERALAMNKDEDIARLYLGMTLARDGERQRGLKEIEGGMRGMRNWLEDIARTQPFSVGKYWDPKREIRFELQTNLAMISGASVDWEKLIANGEWIGKTMEAEIDRARRDEMYEISRRPD